jgi:hypothetical protein
MARIIGFTEQQVQIPVYRADGKIAAGGTPQLILPRAAPRSSILIQNTSSSDPLYFEFGGARATAVLNNGTVSSFIITNAGFGYTYPPSVHFLGGGNISNNRDLGLGYPNQLAPSNYTTAHCVLTNGAVSSIVIDNPGSGYDCPPYVLLLNDPNDNYGAAVPSTTSGFKLAAGQWFQQDSSVVHTDQISVYGANTNNSWLLQYTT